MRRSFDDWEQYLGPGLAFACALLVAGWMLLVPGEARQHSAAIDAGTARSQQARLDAWFHEPQTAFARDNHIRGEDEWLAYLVDPDAEGHGRLSNYAFDVPGDGEVLEKWDGATVTAFLAGDRVIGVRLPDGTVLKSDRVGWYGSVTRALSGVFVLAVALLIGATRLRMGPWTGLAGGVLMALTVLTAVHLSSLILGLVVDVLVVVALVFVVRWVLRGTRREAQAASPPSAEDPA